MHAVEGGGAPDAVRALTEAARLIGSGAVDLDATLDALVDQARRLLDVPDVTINLRDPGTGEYRRRRASALVDAGSDKAVLGAPIQLSLAASEALASGRAVLVEDFQGDPRVNPSSRAALPGVAGMLVVPLADGGQDVGLMVARWTDRRRLQPADVPLAEALGHLAAVAIGAARLHDALARAEARYRLVTEAAPVAVWEWDVARDDVVWSGAGRALLGGPPGESVVPAAWWHERVHPDERDAAIASAARALAAGEDRLGYELRVRHEDGDYRRLVTTLLRLFRDPAGQPIRALGMIQDVTAVRAAEEERDRMAVALARVEERERVAMDLHDGVVASLAGVRYLVAAAERTLPEQPEAAAVTLRTAQERLAGTAEELRAYAHALTGSEKVSLGHHLTELATHARAAGVAVELRVDPAAGSAVGGAAAVEVAMAASEAVSNALRHGAPRHLAIRLAAGRRTVTLQVRDDGLGFDPGRPDSEGGRGLANLAARAARVGGRFSVRSNPGAGTTVRLVLPLTTGKPSADYAADP